MIRILQGDCRDILCTLPDESVHCCVTSPPYFGLRDYGMAGQIGLEQTPQEYVEQLVAVFREVGRVLCRDGTVWLNLGDSYCAQPPGRVLGDAFATSGLAGMNTARVARRSCQDRPKRSFGDLKQKDLIGIPWRVAFGLQADGWWLRQDIIWNKPNPMPESVTDRCTKAHEYIFLLGKNARYYYDAEGIAEDAINAGRIVEYNGVQKNCETIGDPRFATRITSDRTVGNTRNRRSVWTVATQPYSEAHFATFPPALIEPCILAGCPKGGTVLDPFAGAGTTGLVADRLGRNAILIELNPEYAAMTKRRIADDAGMFAEMAAE